MCMVLYTYFDVKIQLLNLSEFLIFFNVNYTCEYSYYTIEKFYQSIDFSPIIVYLKDFVIACQCDYANTPIFFFFGFLFFITVLIS